MVLIRDGKREDLPRALELIRELAEFEKALREVTNTKLMMEEDGFGPSPVFGFFVAEEGERIHGISLYYYRYSTWKGKRLYLEDLIVSETMRGRGLGEKLLNAIIEKARQTACTGLMWQVLDWNEPAINFYKKFGARFDEGWVNVHIDF